MTYVTWCVTVVTVICNITLTSNSKFKNKKMNKIKDRNDKRNKNK